MAVYNMYNSPSEGLYNKQKIRIEEGTLQGCSLSTAVYDLGIKPLLEELECQDVKQIWLCDDLCATGGPEEIKRWLKKLQTKGEKYGYKLKKESPFFYVKTRKS